MLATILIWIYTLLLVYPWGLLATAGLRRVFHLADTRESPLPLTLLAGLCLVTTVASFLSLAIPTGLLTNILLVVGAALVLAWKIRRDPGFLASLRPGRIEIHPLVLALAVLAVLTTLEIATHKPANPDTGIYHAQAIHWIESYRAVPGLGNLQTRFAFNSSWFVANAVFSLSFLEVRSFHLTSSILFLVSLLFFIGGIGSLVKRKISLSALLKTAFFPLCTYLLASEVSSPGSDLPSALLIWICFTLAVELIETQSSAFSTQAAVLALLAAFAVTIKLSSLPLLLLPAGLLAGLLLRRDFRRAAGLLGVIAIVFLPWLARNVILSGYLVYPGPAVDLFHLDWRLPPNAAAEEQASITSWARIPAASPADVMKMPLRAWAAVWFENLTTNRKAFALAAAASPAALLLAGLLGLWKPRAGRAVLYGLAFLAAYAGLLFWFFTAPDFRFGTGYLAAALLLGVAPLAAPVFRRLPWLSILLALALIAYQALAMVRSVETRTLSARLVLPADYVNLPSYPCSLHNKTIFCAAQWKDCGYATFPCALAPREDVELRGTSWQDGFRSLEISP